MGKHSTPCKYVQVRHWCRLCSAQGQARFVVLPGAEPLCHQLPGGHVQLWRDPLPCLQQQGGEAPTATRGWARSGPLAGQAVPRQAPAVPCSWGLTVGHRCHAGVPQGVREGLGVGKISVSLHMNTTAGHSLLRYPGQRQGRLLSSHRDGEAMALLARRRVPPPRPLQGAGFTGKKVTVFQSRVSIWVRFAPEDSHEEPFWTRVVGNCSHLQHARVHTPAQTRARTQERNQQPGLYFVLFSGL